MNKKNRGSTKYIVGKLQLSYSTLQKWVGDIFPLTAINVTHFLIVPTHPFEEL